MSRAIIPAGVVGVWFAAVIFIHRHDFRICYLAVGDILRKSIELVDEGRFEYAGNAFFKDLTLGPLSHLTTAIPLLFRRDVQFLYYFYSLTYFLASLLYYAACRRMDIDKSVSFVAAVIFSSLVLENYSPLIADNSFQLPFYMAVYFYLLASAMQGSPINIVLAWAAVGLCMQLNISSGLLAPATLVALKPRDARQFAAHAAGIAVVLLMHFHLAYQLPAFLHQSGGLERQVDVSEATPPASAYWKMLRAWVMWPLNNPGGSFFWLFIIAILRQKRAVIPTAIKHGAWCCCAFAILVFPILNYLKDNLALYYFNSSFVFWGALFAGSLHALLPRAGKQWTMQLAALGIMLAAAGDVDARGAAPPHDTYFDMERLNDQIAIAERVSQVIYDNDLRDFEIYEHTCDYRWGSRFLRLEAETSMTFASLCRYLHPDLRLRLDVNAANFLVIFVTPRTAASEADPADPAVQRRIVYDQFDAGLMTATVFLIPRAVFDRAPACAW